MKALGPCSRRLVGLFAWLVLLALGACGGGDPPPSTATPTATQAEPIATRPVTVTATHLATRSLRRRCSGPSSTMTTRSSGRWTPTPASTHRWRGPCSSRSWWCRSWRTQTPSRRRNNSRARARRWRAPTPQLRSRQAWPERPGPGGRPPWGRCRLLPRPAHRVDPLGGRDRRSGADRYGGSVPARLGWRTSTGAPCWPRKPIPKGTGPCSGTSCAASRAVRGEPAAGRGPCVRPSRQHPGLRRYPAHHRAGSESSSQPVSYSPGANQIGTHHGENAAIRPPLTATS